MEKLKSIMRAEDDARARLREASDHADSIVNGVAARIAEHRTSAMAEARAEAARRREAILAAARVEAERVSTQGAHDLALVSEAAERHHAAAVEAVLAELAG